MVSWMFHTSSSILAPVSFLFSSIDEVKIPHKYVPNLLFLTLD